VDRNLLEGVFSAVASGDRGAAVATLGKLLDAGEDPRRVLKEFLSLLRRLLMLAAGARADLPESDQKRLAALARAMPYENLLRAVSLALEADALSRRAEDGGLVLQMLVLKLAELPRLKTIEEALSGSAPAAAPSATAPARRRAGRGSFRSFPSSRRAPPSTGRRPRPPETPSRGSTTCSTRGAA
jgi:DNA polymerase-3 subunit gamma/tau